MKLLSNIRSRPIKAVLCHYLNKLLSELLHEYVGFNGKLKGMNNAVSSHY